MNTWNDIELAQMEVCKRLGLSWTPVDKDKMIAISKSLLTEAQPVNGLRVPKCNHIDGWYLWSGGDLLQDADFFHPIHPAHLITKRPLIMKYLGLPYGYRFQFDEKGYEDIWFDQSILETDR